MKNYIKLACIFITFLTLSGAILAQDNTPKTAHYNSVRIEPSDAQPFSESTVYVDSTGARYIESIFKVLPSGLLQASEGSGLEGSFLLPFKNLSAEEIDYITAFINFRAAKKKIGN